MHRDHLPAVARLADESAAAQTAVTPQQFSVSAGGISLRSEQHHHPGRSLKRLSLCVQDDTVHLFFSASVEECEFLEQTAYHTRRWTPGGNIMHAHSTDNGESWSIPRVSTP